MKTEKIIWGLIFVFVGGIILLENFGVINFYWGSVWRFWPIIFVLIGANMLFSRYDTNTSSLMVGTLTVAALIFVGYQGSRPRAEHRSWFDHRYNYNHDEDDNDNGDTVDSHWSTTNNFTEAYTKNTQRAELNIKGGATNYLIADTSSELFTASVRQNMGSYTLEKTSRDSVEVVTFRMREKKGNWKMNDFDGNEAVISINKNPLWDINVEMGAGKTDFDLTPFKIKNLQLKGGAASFSAKLGVPVTTTSVSVETGLAAVEINVPSSVPCRITVDSGLSSKDFKGFEKQADGSFTSGKYDTATKKIDIKLKGGISQFEVNLY
ncbi:MAG: hypothetical protein JWN56_190 [Sphingobacteriales bacterium]|nr:hypothetical protein [Sphingobacteriales bacterium]